MRWGTSDDRDTSPPHVAAATLQMHSNASPVTGVVATKCRAHGAAEDLEQAQNDEEVWFDQNLLSQLQPPYVLQSDVIAKRLGVPHLIGCGHGSCYTSPGLVGAGLFGAFVQAEHAAPVCQGCPAGCLPLTSTNICGTCPCSRLVSSCTQRTAMYAHMGAML